VYNVLLDQEILRAGFQVAAANCPKPPKQSVASAILIICASNISVLTLLANEAQPTEKAGFR